MSEEKKKVKLSSLYCVQMNKIRNYIKSLDAIQEILDDRIEIDEKSEEDYNRLFDYIEGEKFRAMELLEKEENKL